MLEDHEGQCQDCFRQIYPLTKLIAQKSKDLITSIGLDVHLCDGCLMERVKDRNLNRPLRPIGITFADETVEWIDLEPVTMIQATDSKQREISVEVKVLVPVAGMPLNPYAGATRIKLPGKSSWDNVECIDCTINTSAGAMKMTRSEARSLVIGFFKPI